MHSELTLDEFFNEWNAFEEESEEKEDEKVDFKAENERLRAELNKVKAQAAAQALDILEQTEHMRIAKKIIQYNHI